MSNCAPKIKETFHSQKQWDNRTPIAPNLLVLHSTESDPNSGRAVSNYLARPQVEADCHYVVDSDGDVYELVPRNRKAWHVAAYNNRAIGIEQVGRAAQQSWPTAQLEVVAKLLAFLSYHHRVPLRGTFGRRSGVTKHSRLGMAGGGHHDPGTKYPLRKVLRMARRHKRKCYGSVRAYAKG